jgi:hypothetical protein
MRGAKQLAAAMAGAPKFSFISFKERSGKIDWAKHDWEIAKEPQPTVKESLSTGLITSIVTSTFVVYTAVFWWLGGGLNNTIGSAKAQLSAVAA